MTTAGDPPGPSAPSTLKFTPVVVILEDDPALNYAMTRYFTAHGFSVHGADTSDLAVELLHNLSLVHLLIADFRVPGHLNGAELINTVRQMRWPTLKVIVASGEVDGAKEQTRGQRGIAYVQKPFDLAALHALALSLLNPPAPGAVPEGGWESRRRVAVRLLRAIG